jgi:hypothetical protein
MYQSDRRSWKLTPYGDIDHIMALAPECGPIYSVWLTLLFTGVNEFNRPYQYPRRRREIGLEMSGRCRGSISLTFFLGLRRAARLTKEKKDPRIST